jgi:hypothetical protein
MNPDYINPINIDKVAENPGLMEFPHHVGSAMIKPEDRGKIKSKALTSMQEQTNLQLKNLYDQMKLIADQANNIKKRIEVSEMIYDAQYKFDPLVGHIYYLYKNNKGDNILSMLSPQDWGNSLPYSETLAKVKMLGDYTWEVLDL